MIDTIIGGAHKLPTLPGVAVKLLQVVGDADTSLREIAEIISTDPALSARVLGLINSPYYGLRSQITTVQHAVSLLGAATVKNVALSFSVVAAFSKRCGEYFDYSRYWKDSLLSAIACKFMAQKLCPDLTEDAFFLGLLHNIGVLTLHTCKPVKYHMVLTEKSRTQSSLNAIEKRVFGFTHADAGQHLTNRWGLPELFSVPIAYHHEPEKLPEQTAPDRVRFTRMLFVTSQVIDFTHSPEKPACLERIEQSLKTFGFTSKIKLDRLLAECQSRAQSIFPTFDLKVEPDQDYLAMLEKARHGLKANLRLQADMTSAKQVQQNLLPRKAPSLRGLDIFGQSCFCDETGGDYYDFFRLDDSDEQAVGIAVGDVSGHGIAAALIMATVRAYLRSVTCWAANLPEITSHINRLLCMDTIESGSFMTLFCLLLDMRRSCMRWVRAGHDPALVYDPAKDRFVELKGDGIALGVDAGCAYQENCYQKLDPGMLVLLGTDGIWEAQNEDGEKFGKARLKSIVREQIQNSSQQIVQAVLGALDRFRAGLEQEDDITLVAVKRLASES